MRQDAVSDILAGKYGRLPIGNSAAKPEDRPEIVFLHQLGVYPEMREVDILPRRLSAFSDVDLRYRICQQLFEESKHAKLLRETLMVWNKDPDALWYEPIYEWACSFDFMDKLDTITYWSCNNLIGEGLFLEAILVPMKKFEPLAFRTYVEKVMPDEGKHVALGRDLVARLAISDEDQMQVRAASEVIIRQFTHAYRVIVQISEGKIDGTIPESRSYRFSATKGAD